MRKILDNSKETKEYLNSLRKVYLVACWAGFGVLDFPFSGKYKDREKTHPLVYQHDDHNGTVDEWYLRDIWDTTTGYKLLWTFSEKEAKRIAEKKNIERGEAWRNEQK